jgi:hypothetical protein
VAATHVFRAVGKDVNGRDKPRHDTWTDDSRSKGGGH